MVIPPVVPRQTLAFGEAADTVFHNRLLRRHVGILFYAVPSRRTFRLHEFMGCGGVHVPRPLLRFYGRQGGEVEEKE